MIPIHLSLTGFLSYREPVEIDFNRFELACIAGANGAGKSSLLDAMTWALFGQARKRDDTLINAASNLAEVTLVFAYESNIYRVQRTKPRAKTTMLEFHILQGEKQPAASGVYQVDGTWKPLTERTLRATDERIMQTLRMDYETFTNASFFLQGKADQFTQQRPGDRKRILSSILGLEVWETYRQSAVARRRVIEAEISSLDGRLHEIVAELGEEAARTQRLEELETELKRLSKARLAQEEILARIRQLAATLAEQNKLVETLSRQSEAARQALAQAQARLEARREEKETFTDLIARAGEIEAAYQEWQERRAQVERLDEIAGQFREAEKRREGPRAEIQAARARLEQELLGLQKEQEAALAAEADLAQLSPKIDAARAALAAVEEQAAQQEALATELQAARQRLTEAQSENPLLKEQMDELKARIDDLDQTEGALCPLCGQPLSPDERQRLMEKLQEDGKQMGDRFRENLALLRNADELVSALEAQIDDLAPAQEQVRAYDQDLAQLTIRQAQLESQLQGWMEQSEPRQQAVMHMLDEDTYSPEARRRLAQIDAELIETGYDGAAHDKARREEQAGRASEDQMRTLERARATLAPLEREISELAQSAGEREIAIERQEAEYQEAVSRLAAAQADMPDLDAAEGSLFELQEQENRLRFELGAAQQKVLVLDDLKARRQSLEAQREAMAHQTGLYKQLERAFGKDGVPALLIEQALPEIESKANDILERLSAGNMSVRFITQAAYKDTSREDLRETLDIQISDSAGTRDYELFSGGEAFRVNFAIRLALSEVLSQRAGARLQTLVIDEGFGSQDALGRQRLVEAINLVRQDFAKILVITHIDELKDAFPNRIEVEKTALGSMVRVV